MPLHPLTHCGICQSQKVHIYSDTHTEMSEAPNSQDPLMAVCMTCGSHYVESLGWPDAEDL